MCGRAYETVSKVGEVKMQMYDDIYRIAMFGHRDFCSHKKLEDKLIPLLIRLLRTKKLIEIYIGRDGEFDIFAATIIKRVQREYDAYNTMELNLILPYPKNEMDAFEKYYDRVDIPIKAHPKRAITKRNEWMVEQADIVVGYIEREGGGAYKAMQYAKVSGKDVMNLFD